MQNGGAGTMDGGGKGEEGMSPMSKICMVCGDKALGYNFNAVTCESCKAFFRRNALSSKEFTCPFTEDCKVTVITRRFCQKCRLQKCFEVGMKKEYIMSEEDKVMKRQKIEQNRAKKRMSIGSAKTSPNAFVIDHDGATTTIPRKQKKDEFVDLDVMHLPPPPPTFGSQDSMSPSVIMKKELPDHLINCHTFGSPPPVSSYASSSSSCSFDDQQLSPFTPYNKPDMSPVPLFSDFIPRHTPSTSSSSPCPITSTTTTVTHIDENSCDVATSVSTPTEIVTSIIHSKVGTKNMIDKLMKTPKEAVFVMSKIINSPQDAMELIGHLIQSPGDALHIISKIMNSPLDALTVFTQFMSSPTDSFQIIGKIMSSPSDVLQFMQQLMNSPEDALQIMNKFMNAPVEALKIINKMINHQQADSTSPSQTNGADNETKPDLQFDAKNIVIRSVLESVDPRNPTQFNHARASPFGANPMTPSTCECDQRIDEEFQKTANIINDVLKDIQTPPPTPNGGEEGETNVSSYSPPSSSSTISSILAEAIRLEYESYTVNEETQCGEQDLNNVEQEKLKELLAASEALYDPVDDEYDMDSTWQSTSNENNTELLRVINLTAVAIRRFIKMAKKINAFKNMCQEDQLVLLKGGCIEMMILRSLMQYDDDQNTWTVPHREIKAVFGNIRADVLKLAKTNIYEQHQAYISTFEKKWRSDVKLIPIMCAITLFTPDRTKTIHSDVIKLEQTSYYCLLRRYLESIYPGCEAKSTFLKLITKIRELKKLNEELVHVYLDVNPTQIEPLLLEIFDFKLKAKAS